MKCSAGSGPVATVRITIPEAVAAQPGRCTVRVRLTEPRRRGRDPGLVDRGEEVNKNEE